MQTIFKYISQHGAWAFLFMAAISTSLLGPLNQFSFLYTAALLVLPLNISALRKITNINFLIIFYSLRVPRALFWQIPLLFSSHGNGWYISFSSS